MAVQYAKIIQRSAWLNSQFGLDLACRKLNKTPEEIEAIVGRAIKGKRKGQLRGQLVWFSVIEAGWVRMGAYDHDAMRGNGFVQRQKVSYGYAIVNPYKFDGVDNGPLVLAQDADYYNDSHRSLDSFRHSQSREQKGA